MPAKCPLTNIPRGVMRPLIYSFQLTEKYHVTYHVTYQIKRAVLSKLNLFKIPKFDCSESKEI